jgi:alkanesulfonate monooxygenase SsuD/methylene tetrahydromethanopterin reductase-like flavin-dependent oxidoreductase (luciferase family)
LVHPYIALGKHRPDESGGEVMKFGIFYEHQIPRPWDADVEHRTYREALEQVELADRLGIDYAWEVEHHFLEEYSHSSAPEVFLAACSQRTKRIRLGHGIVLMPPGYNHPARVAERIAVLDLVSDGRVEFGTGESASTLELGGYRVDVAEKRAAWLEALEQCLNMMVMAPYPGFEGKYFSMPCRNVVPKPLQKPHPPVWVACSNRDTIKRAAQLGIGALTFAFVDPAEAKQWVDDYYHIIKTECVPIGHAINANIAMVTGFSVHPDAEEARRRGEDGFKFFGYALAHHYIFGEHKPGRTDIWAAYERARAALPEAGAARGIGTPAQLRAHLKSFEDSGVDQVAFIQQAGNNRHDHICQSLELFAREVLPEFEARENERAKRKEEQLAPFIEQAMARKQKIEPLSEDKIPSYVALGRQVTPATQLTPEQEAVRRRIMAEAQIPLENPEKTPAV